MRTNTICSRDGGVGEDDSHNQSVKTESLAENEDEDHTDEDIFLGSCANTGITCNTNGQTGSKGRKTAAQAGGEVLVASVGSVSWSRFEWNLKRVAASLD